MPYFNKYTFQWLISTHRSTLNKLEIQLKNGITIGQEVPKFIPLKTAAIKKEYMADFTPEEREQFKSDSNPENRVKKVYRIGSNDNSKVLNEDRSGYEVPNANYSVFTHHSKNIQEQSAYMNYPSQAPEQ